MAALVGNLCVAAIKFVAFFISGSVSLFSEAVHSIADTTNQALLLVGIIRSVKKPSAEFVYGFGLERFFWALISACGIFFLGAGVVIYNGVNSLINQTEMTHHPIVYVVLAVSFITESITFYLAYRELRHHNPGKSFKEARRDGDPSTLAVLYEDGLAVIGVSVAFLGIILSQLTGQYFWDAAGSIIIGILLAIIAVFLIAKNRQFILGKAIPAEIQDKIIRRLEADPAIERVLDFKSSTLDIGIYRIKCEIEFNGNVLIQEIYKRDSLRDQYDEIKDDYEEFKKFCAHFADQVPRLVGRRIDEIEGRIKEENQSVKHIDIELN